MDTLLHVLGLLLLVLACLGGLASLLVGLPGTFAILCAGLIYGWATGFAGVDWPTIGWLGLLTLVGEGVEFAASALGRPGEAPSRRTAVFAVVGAVVGGILGTPLLFGLGSLLGALAGAFAGAAIAVTWEGGTVDAALAAGRAALLGRLAGFLLKSALAVLMVIVVLAAAV